MLGIIIPYLFDAVYIPSNFELLMVKEKNGTLNAVLNFFRNGVNRVGGYKTYSLFAAKYTPISEPPKI